MQEKIPDLKQFRKESNRHVLVLEAQVSEQDKYKLIHLSNNVLRTAGNDLTGVMKKNYDQLVRTKRYRHLQSLYGKAKKAGRDKEMKAVGAEMKQMQEEYHVTWEFCRQSMIRINKQYHLNSIFALTQAEDVWKGVEACLWKDPPFQEIRGSSGDPGKTGRTRDHRPFGRQQPELQDRGHHALSHHQ